METEKNTVNKKRPLKNDQLVTVLLCALAIPLSMSLWIINIIYSKFLMEHEGLDGKYIFICIVYFPMCSNTYHQIRQVLHLKHFFDKFFFSEPVVISPARWLASCIIPVLVALYGYKRGSVNLSGALLGILVAFVLTLTNFCFLASLFTFFMTSSKATKFRSHLKRKIDEDFKEGILFKYFLLVPYFLFIFCMYIIIQKCLTTISSALCDNIADDVTRLFSTLKFIILYLLLLK